MPKLNIIAGLAAIAALTACATATPYQAALTASDRGFADQKIEDNRYQVSFSGNSLTDRKTVETYLLYRAAELTRLNGYDYFHVVNRNTDESSRVVPVGGSSYSPFYDHFFCHYSFYGPYAAYYRDPYRRTAYPGPISPLARHGYYDPFWGGPAEYREVTSYEATAEIIMGKGEKPDDPAYFDAAQVQFNLEGQIIRPDPAT